MSKEDVLERIREIVEDGNSHMNEEDCCDYCADILELLDEYQEELLIDSGEREE